MRRSCATLFSSRSLSAYLDALPLPPPASCTARSKSVKACFRSLASSASSMSRCSMESSSSHMRRSCATLWSVKSSLGYFRPPLSCDCCGSCDLRSSSSAGESASASSQTPPGANSPLARRPVPRLPTSTSTMSSDVIRILLGSTPIFSARSFTMDWLKAARFAAAGSSASNVMEPDTAPSVGTYSTPPRSSSSQSSAGGSPARSRSRSPRPPASAPSPSASSSCSRCISSSLPPSLERPRFAHSSFSWNGRMDS